MARVPRFVARAALLLVLAQATGAVGLALIAAGVDDGCDCAGEPAGLPCPPFCATCAPTHSLQPLALHGELRLPDHGSAIEALPFDGADLASQAFSRGVFHPPRRRQS